MKSARSRAVLRPALFVAALWAAPPSSAGAQLLWEAPLLVAPNAPAGFGLFIAEMEPGEGVAGLVTWRGEAAPGSIGFRAGLGEGGDDDVAVFGAFDYSGFIHRRDDAFPLDVAWVTGAGVGVGSFVTLSAPLGASFSYPIVTEDLWFNPYATPFLVLDWFLGDNTSEDVDLGLAIDLGADLAFSSTWAVRFGVTVGDRQGIAVGLHFPGVASGG